jgi:hypothetical protein
VITDPVEALAEVLTWARLGRKLSDMMGRVRTVSESDEETLKRIILIALETVCPECWGHKCEKCKFTGRTAQRKAPGP